MSMSEHRFVDADALGAATAELIVDRLRRHRGSQPFLLGCPGGRSARSTFAQLARLAGDRGLDLGALVIVMMDEYLVHRDDTLVAVDPDLPHSCRRFAWAEIVDPLNARVSAAHRISADHVWLPDPADPAGYDERIRAAGGIDVFLVASGSGDGHIAFNAPGSSPDTITRVVDLPDSTRRDNLTTFPSFGGELEAVPRHGVTVGLATVRELSREVVLLLPTLDKRRAAERVRAADHYDPHWPATIVADCHHPRVHLLEGI